MTNRLNVLKESLEKKKALLESKFDEYFKDVASTNGQPLNDKRNGRATLNRWDKQSAAIRKLQEEITITKSAIEKEEGKINDVRKTNDTLPQAILELVESGVLQQWRKHPTTFFVTGVSKGRIQWTGNNLAHKYLRDVPGTEYPLFRDVFNQLRKDLGLVKS